MCIRDRFHDRSIQRCRCYRANIVVVHAFRGLEAGMPRGPTKPYLCYPLRVVITVDSCLLSLFIGGLTAVCEVECGSRAVSYTHLRAHETVLDLVCRLLLEKKKKK